jgi:DNA-binding MarR family transcriptional regulator
MPRLAVLKAIHKLQPTTARDVATETERSTATVWHHVKTLSDEGLVTWEPGKARTLRTTEQGEAKFGE